jgi:hypothetical protein
MIFESRNGNKAKLMNSPRPAAHGKGRDIGLETGQNARNNTYSGKRP